MVTEPSEQARVTPNATPAEAIAWTNADSRVAMEVHRENKYVTYIRMSINCSFICPDIIVTLKVLN